MGYTGLSQKRKKSSQFLEAAFLSLARWRTSMFKAGLLSTLAGQKSAPCPFDD